MIRNLFIALLLMASGTCLAQSNNPQYDAQLAQKLGADEYGMKTYVMAFLKAGPNRIKDSVARNELQMAHLKNIMRLANEGKLVVAGPLQKNAKDYRGIFILNVKTIEVAKMLLETDPAIKSGLLDSEFYGWYGSAALPLYLPASETVGKNSF